MLKKHLRHHLQKCLPSPLTGVVSAEQRYLVSGRSFHTGDTDKVSRRCGYAGVCLSCFSGRTHGHTSCTQKAARFWGQKKTVCAAPAVWMELAMVERRRENMAWTRGFKHLWIALMCICRPFRLDARWPHSSQTNGFSPRCLAASCTRSSVRVKKVLGHSGHCRTFQQTYTLYTY